MDLNLYLRVFWRFRLLVAAGLALAVLLTFLAVVRVGFVDGKPQLVYREKQQWVAYSQIFVTQKGFPDGRVILDTDALPKNFRKKAEALGLQFADPGRFSALAMLYSQLATSDPVLQLMKKDGPIDGKIEAAPILAQSAFQEALPIISIAGLADDPETAVSLSRRTTAAFRTFLKAEQDEAAIPDRYRVELIDVKVPREGELLAGRSITVPMLVFISVMIVTLGICLILENMRPRTQPAELEDAEPAVEPPAVAGGRL